MNVTVRRATADDLPAILSLYQHLSLDVYGPDPGLPPEEALRIFREIEADPRAHLLVAELIEDNKRKVIGTVKLDIYPNFTHGGAPAGVVDNMVVEPAYQRQGVGRILLAEIDRIAREAGCYKLSLTSHQDRTWAHAFYEALGWKRSHEGYTLMYSP
jgi:GNAT superfamily N-acetyltransferase